ncbi:MAG: hypothetical protein IKU94_03500 [Bacteroidaceae bacterium]|nr:hypothetical protein [Bacteroidaceae bacterium]
MPSSPIWRRGTESHRWTLRLCGCFRLSARIADLKKRGYAIMTEKVKVDGGKYVARYSLAV